MKTTTEREINVMDIEVNEPIHVTANFYLHVGPSLFLNSNTLVSSDL